MIQKNTLTSASLYSFESLISALIKAEINDSKEYNDAEVNVKIGNRRRKIKWNEFESMMGTYDISEKLYNAYSKSKDFVRELYISVDEYYNMITDSEVI